MIEAAAGIRILRVREVIDTPDLRHLRVHSRDLRSARLPPRFLPMVMSVSTTEDPRPPGEILDWIGVRGKISSKLVKFFVIFVLLEKTCLNIRVARLL